MSDFFSVRFSVLSFVCSFISLPLLLLPTVVELPFINTFI